MADERVNLSSFNYVQNNPIGRVDPTGMLDNSGWHVSESGEVQHNSATSEEEFKKLNIKGDWIENEFTVDNLNGTKTVYLANEDKSITYNGFELKAVGEKSKNKPDLTSPFNERILKQKLYLDQLLIR